MIRVTQTLIATTADGETFPSARPVEVQWYKGESLVKAASAVAQIMADSENKDGWAKTVSINVDLEWSE